MSSMSLEQRLEAHRERMTPAVLRVARFLVDHPERALVATAAEIAESARTSDATVVRAVQTLGYAGLPELRRGVGEQLVARYDPREALDQSVARVRNDPRSVLDTVIDDAITLLAETRGVVDHDEFVDSLHLLADADRIVVVGWGTAGAMAQYAVARRSAGWRSSIRRRW
jgi:DNA-binding MurR/RpiR family transcriptional regulator